MTGLRNLEPVSVGLLLVDSELPCTPECSLLIVDKRYKLSDHDQNVLTNLIQPSLGFTSLQSTTHKIA